ncbi:MAG: GntR family transcriptional regulator [Nitrospirae bacterium]|nr:GntR family transcriptional regulator [Nitrospirota bacterium]
MGGLINREYSQKLYVQLYELLKGKIESGEWKVDTQIPTEEDLCKIYEISKATVRLAISEMVRQGYLRRQQGKGTFVCKRVIPEGLSMLTSFKELMLEAGVVFETKVLAQTVMMPTDEINLKLDVHDDAHVIYLKRLRLVDNEPVLLQETYIPHHVCPQLLSDDLEHNSLLELLEAKHNIKITKVKGYIGIAYLSADEASLLELREDSAALLIEQFYYSGETQIQYTRSIKQPERFRFFIELDRSQ